MEEILKNYNKKIVCLKSIKREIIKLEQDEISLNTSNFCVNGDIRAKGYLKSITEEKIARKADNEIELENLKANLENEIITDKEFIDSILSILKQIEKSVIELFYFKHLSINKIAKIVDRQDQTVRLIKMQSLRKCDDFIQKNAIQQNFNKNSTEFQ